jgi:hypothetical protein
MVRLITVVACVAASATMAAAYERPELYSVDANGDKHCTGMCRKGAPFTTMMPGVMQLKAQLDHDCASRGMCARDDLPSSGVGADCVDGVATLADGTAYECKDIDL